MAKLLLVAERVFDGERAFTDGAVLVDDRAIAWVGKRRAAPAAAKGAREVALPKSTTLLPGFIDCHVHLTSTGGADFDHEFDVDPAALPLRAVRNALAGLRAGVTTMRDLGAPTFASIELGRAVARGELVGPNVVAAGRGITSTGGHGWQIGRQADGADEVRKAVREQVIAGAGVIKIFSTGGVLGSGAHPDVVQLTEDETRAAILEAHSRHLRVATHAHATQGMRLAIAAGVDSIEHATLLDRETIRLCKSKDVALVPTFSALRAILAHRDALDAGTLERAVALVERHREGIRDAYQAGVRIATGTDSGTPFNHTRDFAGEIDALREVGFSAEEALRAATSVAASVLGRDDLGRLRVGARADLIALAGDPFKDASALRRVVGVWRDGMRVDASTAAGRA